MALLSVLEEKLYCVSYYYANNLAVKPEKAGKM